MEKTTSKVLGHVELASIDGRDAKAFMMFLSDLLELNGDDFVDALVDIFGIGISHSDPVKLKSHLSSATTLERLTFLKETLTNDSTRNKPLCNLLIHLINSIKVGELNTTWNLQHTIRTTTTMDIENDRIGVSRLPLEILDVFDEDWFCNAYCHHLKGITDVRTFFLEHAEQMGWYPLFMTETRKHALLQQVAYRDNQRLSHFLSSLAPLNHSSDLYIKYRITQTGLFLDKWYRAKYPDIKDIDDTLMHYVIAGEKEGRCPNPYFDPIWYMNQNDISSELSLLLHYIEIGHLIGLHPSRFFDPKNYQNLLIGAKITRFDDTVMALARYLSKGAEWIGELSYSSENPSLKIAIAKTSLENVKKPNTSFEHNLKVVLDCSEIEQGLRPAKSSARGFDPYSLRILWVIPDFEKGGGGHTTIFRMIKLFAVKNHQQCVLISNRSSLRNSSQARDMIFRDFFVANIDVHYRDELDELAFDALDVVVATSFETVKLALNIEASTHFYFVQDYEPYFHPAGSLALLAERTYKADINCICASDWLKAKMETHGRWATSFRLAVDDSAYYRSNVSAVERDSVVPRIVLYGRSFTARRCVELGIAALIRLVELGEIFHVDIIHGDSIPDEITLPFSNTRYPTLTPNELAEIYRKGTVGMVFSATNYSLLPQEMLACGLDVVDIISESTAATYPDGVVHLVEPEPWEIARKLQTLIKGDRSGVSDDVIKEWISYSWDDACAVVNAAFLERLEGSGLSSIPTPRSLAAGSRPKVSIVVPVYNGMRELPTLVERLYAQRAPWQFEIIVIDSSSNDRSFEFLMQHPEIRVHTIPKHEFGHGKTRNLGCQLSHGEFIAFLTQDAFPVGQFWLYNLVTSLEAHSDAAAVFGRHIAHANANPFTIRDIDLFFKKFYRGPQCISIATDWSKYGITQAAASEYIRYYSDNNSCLRRTAWEIFPYPEIEYGEDQVWANQICLAGYAKVYAHQAIVEHSHDYDAHQTFDRAKIEAEFFLRYFAIELIDHFTTASELEKIINEINDVDKVYGQQHGFSNEIIKSRCEANHYRIHGYMAGVRSEYARQHQRYCCV